MAATGADGVVGEAVAGMAFEAERLGMRGGGDEPLQVRAARAAPSASQ